MIQGKQKSGFTLVELMLSMAFIGALLLAIAVTSMQIMSTYTKGITVREVNQAGRTISEDLQRTIGTSAPFSVATMYVNQPDVGGRLCTGAYTYAWNYGKELSKDEPTPYNSYDGSGEEIRLVKVSDVGGALCINPSQQIQRDRARELLSGGDRNLAVQRLEVISGRADSVSGQELYAITLVLSTNDQAQINTADATCLAPTKGSGSEDFCAINQFEIIARAGNRSGSL